MLAGICIYFKWIQHAADKVLQQHCSCTGIEHNPGKFLNEGILFKLSIKSKNNENDPFNKLQKAEPYFEPSWTSWWSFLAKVVKAVKYFRKKSSIVVVWFGSKYASGIIILSSYWNKVLVMIQKERTFFFL